MEGKWLIGICGILCRALEKKGELERISAEVDPVLEITEITDRVVKAGGPALLFEQPKGSKIPVVTNLVGSERRMCLALEVDSLDEVAERVHSFLDMQSPQGILEKVKMLPKLAEIGSFFPKTVRSGDCQEVVRTENFSLDYFPILQCWPQDGGRYITWPMVITKNPETGKRNVGCYRMQVYDERTTGMHWQTQKHGAEHFRNARAKNPKGKLEVAVAIGADPATALAGILPVPPDMDEFLFSGFLRREPVELVQCKTVDLEVPANAEIVLEGHVNLGEMRTEGPFGDHTGFYSLEGEFPVFHIDLHHASQGSAVSDDDCGAASAGRLFYGPRDRADFSAGDEDAISGDCGCGDAGGRNFSELDDCGDPEELSGAGAQDYERDMVAGAGDVYEGGCGGGPRCECAGLARSGVEGAVRDRSGAGYSICDGAGGYAGPCGAAAGFWVENGNGCHAEMDGRRVRWALAGRDKDG